MPELAGLLTRNFGLPRKTPATVLFGVIIGLALLAVFVMSALPQSMFHTVDVWTADVLGWLLGLGVPSFPRGNSVTYSLAGQFRTLTVGYGCDGLLAGAIVLAAILPFPSRLLTKLAGLGLGLTLVLVVNQVRLIGLAVALRYLPAEEFEFYHVVVGQIFVLLVVCIYWSAWTRHALKPWIRKPDAEPEPQPEAAT